MVLVMSEEQVKAAEAEATAQVEENVEEISEEDLAGVAGGYTLVDELVVIAAGAEVWDNGGKQIYKHIKS